MYHCLWAPFLVDNSEYVAALYLFYKALCSHLIMSDTLNTDIVKH